jgi:hypothetical protein
VAVYEVTLPKYYYTAATGDAPLAEPTPEMLVGGQLRLVLHFSIAVIKSECGTARPRTHQLNLSIQGGIDKVLEGLLGSTK